MQAATEIVTPAMAKEYLERGYPNRQVKESVVSRYASDMSDGLWLQNGQGLVFAANGQLLDGQHRLHAIIRSGVSISMLVVRGVDTKAFVTMDSGTVRTLADVLGIEEYKYRHNLAAAARLAYNYIAGVSLDYVLSRGALEKFISNHRYITETVETACAPNKRLPKTALTAVFLLANEGRTQDKEVAQFMEALVYGDGLWRGDARLTLREWYAGIITDRNANTRGGSAYMMFGAVARCWNAFAAGRELSAIRNYQGCSRENLEIHGFDLARYGDVPDLIVQQRQRSLQNLQLAHKKRNAQSAGAREAAHVRLDELREQAKGEATPVNEAQRKAEAAKLAREARARVQAKAMARAATR